MVLAVCRRVLHNLHDADDVFQAAFLVVARKAKARGWRDSVANWLYLVAYRLALRVREAAQRRARHESRTTVAAPIDPLEAVSGRELCAALDDELSRLPDRYRAGIVLCCLEGKTRDEAAQMLGWSPRMLKRRLERGRALLRARLEKRGFELPSVLAGVLVAEGVSRAMVPTGLLQTVLMAATTGTASSERVLALVCASLQGMLVSRLRVAAGVLLAATFLSGVGLAIGQLPRDTVLLATKPPVESAMPARTDSHGDPLPPGVLFRAGTVRFRHGGPVAAVVFSPDGKILASASWDHTVRLWDTVTGNELRRLSGHQDAVFCVAFAPDGKLGGTLASAGKDKTVRLWDISTGKEKQQIGRPTHDVNCLAFSPDGKLLAGGGRHELVRLWDVATGKELRTLAGQQQLKPIFGNLREEDLERPKIGCLTLAFSPDGKTLAGGNKDGSIRLWDVGTGNEVRRLEGHRNGVISIAFAPGGKTLVSGAAEEAIRLWDLGSGRAVRQLTGHRGAVFAVAYAPGGKAVGSGGQDGSIRLWDAASGEELARQDAGGDHVYGIAFSPDGTALASAHAQHTIALWSVSASARAGRKEGPGGEKSLQHLHPALQQAALVPFTFSPDGLSLAAVSRDGMICLCEPATGKEIRRLGPHRGIIMSLVFAPDGKWLASGSWSDPAIRVWDVAGDKPVLELRGHENAVRSLALSPDGKALVSASYDKSLRLWDLAAGKELHRWAQDAYLAVAFAPDGKVFADSRYDGTIHLWETATGREVRRLQTGEQGSTFALAFSPDSRVLAVAGQNTTVRLFEVATGRLRCQFSVRQGSIHSLAFTSDGRTLATGGGEALTHFRDLDEFKFAATARLSDYAVCLWDVTTGKQVRRLEGHQGGVFALAFSRDGRALVSRSWDTTALVWGLPAARGQPAPPSDHLTPEELQDLWTGLREGDAEKAHRALGKLEAAPEQAVELLGKRLRPVPTVSPARLAELLTNLDSDDFSLREQATHELKRLAELAEEDVRKALQARPSLEMRRRLEDIVANLKAPFPPPERLQSLRALEMLEHLGTPAARQVLERLSQGAPKAWLTREADASVQRLGRRLAAPGR
jgi:RNA polymerase sigma factor (sigma-70 family)